MTHPAWDRAVLALRLLAIDPVGLGGIWLRGRAGPVRDRFLAALPAPLPHRRLHPAISDEQLYGGVDLPATLTSDKVIYQQGLMANPSLLILPMAERTSPGLAARLGIALDQKTGHALVALDEGATPEEALPPALADRLALHLDLSELGFHDTAVAQITPPPLVPVTVPPGTITDLAAISVRLGISSLRAPLLALAAARTHAVFQGRVEVDQTDLLVATELVLAPRATQIPDAEADHEPPPPPPDTSSEGEAQDDTTPDDAALPQEILLKAVRAMLPADLLARLAAGKAARATGSAGTGAKKRGNRRGRPLPSRPGRLGGDARIDLVATLRAAAPWQPLRRSLSPRGQRLHIRPADIRVKQYQETSDRLLIFVVDASGSAAMARLAEAKGAVELLLVQAYARRDHVALIAFRGTGAELLLPPTRSLVQTKRRLAALPGGGGTPMAAGLQAALDLALQARGRGLTPTVALLTDGRANIALDGSADRRAAQSDAMVLARALARQGVPALIIDTGARPQPQLRDMAKMLDAPYLPLPRADAARLGAAVSAALEV
ncbi:magnesium chelatase subunit D [Actibacterium sp. 188UL27-1]|uniref:magnesium chelatase subunit D n=1 Tax=Actibacterium sp. 188UL27-1 TaxID=2786961 RepID=UPI00195B6F58|nr:magnesium chelatase subunit D [Actibacterium sp. 188UL27-1]